MKNQVAVIGLGLMGSPMAARLTDHGFDLRGFDVDPDRLREFEALGGTPTGSPAEAVEGCWGALLSLPTSEVSRTVCLGKGGIGEAEVAPLYVFDTTTGDPDDAVEIAGALEDGGVVYADATVSGNSEIAARGELVVMMGGSTEAFERGIPVFEAIGRSHHHVGPVGAGSRMKLIVNHALGIHRMALGEALVVAELAGTDAETTLAVLKDSLAYSRAMDAWGEQMISADHTHPFARLRQSSKDARLIVAQGEALGATMDLARVVRDAFAEGEAGGLADLDNSAIIEVVRRRAGIGRVD